MKSYKMVILLCLALLLTWLQTMAQIGGGAEKVDTVPCFFLVAVKGPVGPAFLVSGYRVTIKRISGGAPFNMESEIIDIDIAKKRLPANWFVWDCREIKNFRHE